MAELQAQVEQSKALENERDLASITVQLQSYSSAFCSQLNDSLRIIFKKVERDSNNVNNN